MFDASLATLWPPRFDLDTLRSLLGDEVSPRLAEILGRCVNAPLWTLLDRRAGHWRPQVSRLAYLACGGPAPTPDLVCQVAELLHTGSLVVDDIQDDACERRGGPAAHVVHGMPFALNAANAAYFRAFEALRHVLPAERRLRAMDMMSEELLAAHLGQALDLALGDELRRGALPRDDWFALARAKTGGLVRIAARLGAIAAGASSRDEATLAEWASLFATAYQMQNDLDDLLGDMRDVAAGRPTFPLVLLAEDDGAAACAMRTRLGAADLDDGDRRALRTLITEQRIPERVRAIMHEFLGNACAALRGLPDGDARHGLERFTTQLVREATGGPASRP